MADAGQRFPLLKPLLERCLSLHGEDRPSSAEALRALEGLRADPCAYRPAGHGGGVLADRWFKVRKMLALSVLGSLWLLLLLGVIRSCNQWSCPTPSPLEGEFPGSAQVTAADADLYVPRCWPEEIPQLHNRHPQHHAFAPIALPLAPRGATRAATKVEQKEKCRGLEARLRVHERRLSAEVGRWKEEADRADEMSGRIGAAESERDAAVKR